MNSYDNVLDRLCNEIIEISEKLDYLEESIKDIRFSSENYSEE